MLKIRLKSSVCVSIALFLSVFALGQMDTLLQFNQVEYHVDQLFELDGEVAHVYEFTNRGKSPVQIKGVTTSCGCTSPEYTRDFVAPGNKGMIKVVYNPAGQAGAFSQRITVYHSAGNKPIDLKFSGLVIPGGANQEYKYNIADLKILSKQLNYGFVLKGTSERMVLPIWNNAEENMIISVTNIPEGFDVLVKPVELQPKQHGMVEVTYHSGLVNEWDFIYHYIALEIEYVGSGKHARGLFTATANVQEDFSRMTAEDSAMAPVAFIKELTHQFDTLTSGEVVDCGFELKNNGKRDLIIRKIAPSCGCTVVQPDDSVLKPGQSTTIHATFDSKDQPGKINKGITLVTNDPVNPKQYLRLQGFVKSH